MPNINANFGLISVNFIAYAKYQRSIQYVKMKSKRIYNICGFLNNVTFLRDSPSNPVFLSLSSSAQILCDA